MGFECPICCERLEKLQGGRGNSYLSTPCGHIFHAYCIEKWLSGNLSSSRQCPCCRKIVSQSGCIPVFLDQVDDSILHDSMLSQPLPFTSSGVGVSAPATCNHGELISSLKSRIERFQKEKHENETWMIKAEGYLDLANYFEQRMKMAESLLKNYTEGVVGSLDEDRKKFPPNATSVESLIQMKHILSKKLRNVSIKLDDVIRELKIKSSDYDAAMERFYNVKHESRQWEKKAKQLEKYPDMALDFENRMKNAERQLKEYTEDIETALKGVEGLIDEDKGNVPPDPTSTESLIQPKDILSRLVNLLKRPDDVKTIVESTSPKKINLRVHCDKPEKDLNTLGNMYEIARLNGRVRSTSPVAGPSSMCDSTPNEFRKKRRLQESLPHWSELELSANDAFIASSVVDSVVDLYLSAVKAKKTKPSTSQDANKDHGKETKQEFPVGKLPITSVTSVPVSKDEEKPVNLNASITRSDGSCDELLDLDDEDDFRIHKTL